MGSLDIRMQPEVKKGRFLCVSSEKAVENGTKRLQIAKISTVVIGVAGLEFKVFFSTGIRNMWNFEHAH